jgi:DNA-binding HxlR family transcriptional regulator
VARRCSLAEALAVVGERWSLLVVREVALGVGRFDDIHAATGAPRAILADRLRKLVDAGVLTTVPYKERGSRARMHYRLTESGRDLRPALVALTEWGDRHASSGPVAGQEPGPDRPVVFRHRGCGREVHARLVCDCGRQPLSLGSEVLAEITEPAGSQHLERRPA